MNCKVISLWDQEVTDEKLVGLMADGRSLPVVAHFPVQERSRHAIRHMEAPAWCCSVGLGRPAGQPPERCSLNGFTKVGHSSEASHAVFLSLDCLLIFLLFLPFLGPTVGPGACLQKHCKNCCPFRWSPLPGLGSHWRGVFLGLRGRRTSGPWRHRVCAACSCTWYTLLLCCCNQNKVAKISVVRVVQLLRRAGLRWRELPPRWICPCCTGGSACCIDSDGSGPSCSSPLAFATPVDTHTAPSLQSFLNWTPHSLPSFITSAHLYQIMSSFPWAMLWFSQLQKSRVF